VVIGHEMTHGFDDQGSKFDLNGNVRVWWSKEDLAKFSERTECEAKEYDGFEVAPGQNLNGHLTLGENTADNGGLRIAFQALQATIVKEGAAADPGYVDGKKDGYTEQQRFFIGFGQVWCQNQTEQSARVLARPTRTVRGVADERQCAELRGVRQGVRLQGGSADEAANSCRVW